YGALPRSGLTKRGRPSTRRRHENWMIMYSTTLSTLLPFSELIPQPWQNSNSGMQASSNMRISDLRSYPILRHTLVTLAGLGNSVSELWTPLYGLTTRKMGHYGRR